MAKEIDNKCDSGELVTNWDKKDSGNYCWISIILGIYSRQTIGSWE